MLMITLADIEGEVENFPLAFQIACILLTALFLLTFSVARDPRSWRRLYQAKVQRRGDFSVNKNKALDERIKKYGIMVAMLILVVDVSIFVYGVTYKHRVNQRVLTREEMLLRDEMQKFKENIPKDSRRQGM